MVTTPPASADVFLPALGRFIAFCGRTVAWLTLGMVLLTAVIVVLRYGFSLGWIWLQESLTYLHVIVFSIAMAWTLQQEGHVRVDIFYTNMSARKKALVDLIGTCVFLIPFCIFMMAISWTYVASAWHTLEGSHEAGGLPLVYLLKSLILVLPSLLLCQAIINAGTHWNTLRKSDPGPEDDG